MLKSREKELQESYCNYLLIAQKNHTLTYFVDHSESISHDQMTRYLSTAKLSSEDVWEYSQDEIEFDAEGCILFDDTVIDKNHSHKIELVRRQYSGNSHSIIKGIGVVNCVYYNSKLDKHWLIDYRIFNIEEDGKSKHSHVYDMIHSAIFDKKINFLYVLMDTWYATEYLMKAIESLHKIYYCPIKSNRMVRQNDEDKYEEVSKIEFSQQQLATGLQIHLRGFPQSHRVQLFYIEASTSQVSYVVTNSKHRQSAERVAKMCALRWKIEQIHRELKQLTGIEKCQCRRSQSQKNHIACANIVLTQMHKIADKFKTTAYQIKEKMLDDYTKFMLKNPPFNRFFA